MAALSITTSSVGLIDTQSSFIVAQYGATISPGQVLYYDYTDGKVKLALNNGTDEEATVYALALYAGVDTDYQPVLLRGNLNIGAVTTKPTTYVLGSVAGSIEPITDLITSEKIVTLFTGSGSNDVNFNYVNTGLTA